VMITSAATVARAEALTIDVKPSTHPKCERCWHYRPEVGKNPAHPTLCARCCSHLDGSGEPRTYA